jgi:hypothetical protein
MLSDAQPLPTEVESAPVPGREPEPVAASA